MSAFLLVYDRGAGRLLRMERYEKGSDAMHARFRAEAGFRGRTDVEIVALAAASEDDLMHTHGRYFLELRDLAARMS